MSEGNRELRSDEGTSTSLRVGEVRQRVVTSAADCVWEMAEAARFRRALPCFALLGQHTKENLRASVQDYARCLRLLDTPPERTLVMVKEILNEAMTAKGVVSRELMQLVVHAMVAAYYSL